MSRQSGDDAARRRAQFQQLKRGPGLGMRMKIRLAFWLVFFLMMGISFATQSVPLGVGTFIGGAILWQLVRWVTSGMAR